MKNKVNVFYYVKELSMNGYMYVLGKENHLFYTGVSIWIKIFQFFFSLFYAYNIRLMMTQFRREELPGGGFGNTIQKLLLRVRVQIF